MKGKEFIEKHNVTEDEAIHLEKYLRAIRIVPHVDELWGLFCKLKFVFKK